MNRFIVFALALLLAGCAGSGSVDSVGGAGGLKVIGDERGGSIPNGMSDVPAAMRMATAYCAKYNKRAGLTKMQTEKEGGLVAFDCR